MPRNIIRALERETAHLNIYFVALVGFILRIVARAQPLFQHIEACGLEIENAPLRILLRLRIHCHVDIVIVILNSRLILGFFLQDAVILVAKGSM